MKRHHIADNSDKQLSGWQKLRPIRIAFLVEQSENIELILDAIFADCYSRWGGRFSLVVPCEEGQIVQNYLPWLETFDPDIIYSYVSLQKATVLDIHERFTPADYIFHELTKKNSFVVGDFRPQYNFNPLSSLSTIFNVARHSPNGRIKIIDSWYTEHPTRLLTDNLGTYISSTYTSIYPRDASEAASLLTIVSEEHFRNSPQFVPSQLDQIPDEYSAFRNFFNRQATCMSLLSARQPSRLELNDHRWSNSFNLVIGDSFEDRLLFWNARHFIPTWLDGSLCCLRVTPTDLEDTDFAQIIALLINEHNYIKGSNGQEQLSIRSASLNEEELQNVLVRLKAENLLVPARVEVVSGGHALPNEVTLRKARVTAHALFSDSNSVEGRKFNWTPPNAKLPAEVPVHLRDAPPNQAFTLGHWAIDIHLEQNNENSMYGQGNLWILPKRWRLATAFRPHFENHDVHRNFFSITRTSQHGALTILSSLSSMLESISIPDKDNAIYHALCTDSAPRQLLSNDPVWPERKMQNMQPSDQAQYLIGVLGLAGGLSRARDLLLHPFLQKLFADFGGTSNIAHSNFSDTMSRLQSRASQSPMFDISDENERSTLAQLIVSAAKSIKTPKAFTALKKIEEQWNCYCSDYREKHSDSMQKNELENDNETLEKDHVSIAPLLGELRSRQMLFQGYSWKCNACQHRNWTDFQALKALLACDICMTEQELPVVVPWHFKPNDFLIESLRMHSVLSLVWLIDALRSRARKSFIYWGPTKFNYRDSPKGIDGLPDREADLLAIIDGQAVLCEVKTAWRSLRNDDLNSLMELSLRLRPDLTILAIMEDEKNKLEAQIEDVRNKLKAVSIKFELLTLDMHPVDGEPYRLTLTH